MKEKTKKFNTAPLPFMGQKRNFLKEFSKALENYPSNAIYVDLFGGSGLLSHTVKQHYPEARVIYNDYDNYAERLANIPRTNALLADFRTILADYPKDKRIDDPYRRIILERLRQENESGFVDWITVSSSILFCMKYFLSYEEFQKSTMYNCMKLNDYNADGYLEGVEIVRDDYKKIYEQYKDCQDVVIVLDPPYLSTDVKAYKNYWRLADYLDVLKVLNDSRYFYFTSNKSSIVELCDWIQTNTGGINPFDGATTVSMKAVVTFQSSYTDMMLYK